MTLDDDEPVSIQERYSAALNSSNLRVQERTDGAVDMLMAAAWCEDTLGVRLFRLRAEFDALKASLEGRVGNNSVTERWVILSRLKSLGPAKEAVGNLAIHQATVLEFMAKDEVVRKIVGRVLDLFLDPSCPKCTGRRINRGGKDAVEDVVDVDRIGHTVLCRPCSGTGKRPYRDFGQNEGERAFARHLLDMLEGKMAHAASGMSKLRRQEILRAQKRFLERTG